MNRKQCARVTFECGLLSVFFSNFSNFQNQQKPKVTRPGYYRWKTVVFKKLLIAVFFTFSKALILKNVIKKMLQKCWNESLVLKMFGCCMNKIFNEVISFKLNKRNKIRSNRLMFDIIQSSTEQKPRIIIGLMMFVFKCSYDFYVEAQKHPSTSSGQ